MATKQKTKVSEFKVKEIKELVKLIDGSNTIMLASIKGLPAKNFQKIKKSIRGKAIVKIVKKRALNRAIKDSKKENISNLSKHLQEDIAVLFSDIDAFELSGILSKSKSPVKAKPGQESPQDIEIEAGMTELPAGPAISELSSAGLQVKVTSGKIEIIKSHIIVKKGAKISDSAASTLGKLNILPFSVGFVPLIAYDSKDKEILTELNIDVDKTKSELVNLFIKARAFAVHLGYVSKDTIGMLLAKANSHEKALSKFIKSENNQQINSEEGKE